VTLSVAVPRWFIDKIVNKNTGIKNPELKQIINEWLGRYGKLFTPLTFDCEEVCGSYSCCYNNAIRQIRILRDALMRLHSLEELHIKTLILHTEYQIPMWWCSEYVNRYVRAITRVVKELRSINIGREISNLVIEVHPGFGSPNKNMDLKPIAHGIKRLITGMINDVLSNGFKLMVTVESRGSSSTISRKEQAAATIDRLEELRKLVEDELKDFGIPVASVIDVPQLIMGYVKVKKVEKPKAVEYVIDEVLKYVKERGDKVGEAHIHWYRDSRNLRNPHAPIPHNAWNEVYKPIIAELGKLNNDVTIVPEITMFKANDLLKTLRLIREQIT
jgi:hypothetical protein